MTAIEPGAKKPASSAVVLLLFSDGIISDLEVVASLFGEFSLKKFFKLSLRNIPLGLLLVLTLIGSILDEFLLLV